MVWQKINNTINDNFFFYSPIGDEGIDQGTIIISNQFTTKFGQNCIGIIIGTFSCDIPKRKITHLYILPIFPLKHLIKDLFYSFIRDYNKKAKKHNEEQKKTKNHWEIYEEDLKNYSKIGKKFRNKHRKFLREIFQFKNRFYFLLCPYPEICENCNDEWKIEKWPDKIEIPWAYVNLNKIISDRKDNIMVNFEKKNMITIASPYKEKFGYILGSRINKVGTINLDSCMKDILEDITESTHN